MKRRGPEIGIHRCKAGAYPIQQDRGVATSMGEIDCRAYRADVRLGCRCVPFRAPKAHGVQYLDDLIVVEGHESLEHLRASRSKQQEHL